MSTLDVSTCNLDTIDPRHFYGMVELRKLLAGNVIRSINPFNITWNVSISEMELTLYQCREIKQEAFRGLRNLTKLVLVNQYTNNVRHQYVIIDINLRELAIISESTTFTHLKVSTPTLKVFYFELLDGYYGNWNVWGLVRAAETIEEVSIHARCSVTYIIYQNKSVFCNMSNLLSLDLSKNRFEKLPSGTFRNLSSLKTLSISKNQIRIIAHDAFIGLPSLETLDLKENNLLGLPGELLLNIKSLLTLHLDSNALMYLEKDLFASSRRLTTLTLSHNQLTSFNSSLFDPLRSSLNSIDLSENNLMCSCEIKWLLESFSGLLLRAEETLCSYSQNTLEPLRGKPITLFKYDKYCGLDIRLCFWIFGSCLALISMTISYHYRWFLRYKLYLMKLAVLGYKRNPRWSQQG